MLAAAAFAVSALPAVAAAQPAADPQPVAVEPASAPVPVPATPDPEDDSRIARPATTQDAPPPAAPIDPPVAAPTAPAAPAAASAVGDWYDLPPLAWGGFAVGGAFLVTGIISGIVTLKRTSDLEQRCLTQCYASEIDSNLPRAHLATASFIIAGVGIGVGIAAIVLSSSETSVEAEVGSLKVRPMLGPVSGLEGRF